MANPNDTSDTPETQDAVLDTSRVHPDAPPDYTPAFAKFLLWEAATRDTIDFKKIYVDIADDLLAGLTLSEIVYWYLPSKQGTPRTRVERDGKHWIACRRSEWWDRVRMTPKQIDRALKILEGKKLIEKRVMVFSGAPTVHVRLLFDVFMHEWNFQVSIRAEQANSPKVKKQIDQRVKTITETTTEVTQEKKPLVASDGEVPSDTTHAALFKAVNDGLYNGSGRNDLLSVIASWLRGGKAEVKISRGRSAPMVVAVRACEPPATVEEVERFAKHWRAKGLSAFEEADKFVRQFLEWRAPRPAVQALTATPPTYTDHDSRIDALVMEVG